MLNYDTAIESSFTTSLYNDLSQDESSIELKMRSFHNTRATGFSVRFSGLYFINGAEYDARPLERYTNCI